MNRRDKTLRQEKFWGEEGQEILKEARVMLIGADTLGIETAKALAVLGIGGLVIGDDALCRPGLDFVEQPLSNDPVPAALALAQMLKRFVGDPNYCSSEIIQNPVHDVKMYLTKMNEVKPDLLVCTSNDPRWQGYAASLAEEKRIPLVLGTCDDQGLSLRFFPGGESSGDFVKQYRGRRQSRLVSSVAAGLVAERTQQILFQGHADKLEKVIIKEESKVWQRFDGSPFTFSAFALEHYHPYEPVEFRFPSPVRAVDTPKCYAFFGAGAIINHTVKNLAPLVRGRAIFVDFDRVHPTNLNRCELFWDAQEGEIKADILRRKASFLNPDLDIVTMYGFVGRPADLSDAAMEASKGEGPFTVVGEAQIAALDADVFVAGFDNFAAREYLNSVAAKRKTPYIDGGSTIVDGRVTPFLPGRTGCLDCTEDAAYQAKKYRDKLRELRETSGCPEAAPSIDATNRIVGGLQAYVVLQAMQDPARAKRFWHSAVDTSRPPIYEMPVKQKAGCACPPVT